MAFFDYLRDEDTSLSILVTNQMSALSWISWRSQVNFLHFLSLRYPWWFTRTPLDIRIWCRLVLNVRIALYGLDDGLLWYAFGSICSENYFLGWAINSNNQPVGSCIQPINTFLTVLPSDLSSILPYKFPNVGSSHLCRPCIHRN